MSNTNVISAFAHRPLDEKQEVSVPVFRFSTADLHLYDSGAELPHTIDTLSDLSKKDLLVIFYSAEWSSFGSTFLQNALAHARPGQDILIITDDKADDLAGRLNRKGAFYIYTDNANGLAAKFGTWNSESPAWDRFSGLNKNVPYLAEIKINKGQVHSRFIDYQPGRPEKTEQYPYLKKSA